jgi:hypothetical protein
MTNKELAAILDLDPSNVTRLMSIWSCPPEVQEAAKAGKIGISDWYAISQESDPILALKERLGTGKSTKKPSTKKSASVTVDKMNLHHQSGAVVKITGADLSLDSTIELLSDLIRQIKKASSQGLDSKTFQNVLKDMAAAAG